MTNKVLSFKIRGMNRDTSISSFNPLFAYENHNIRITARNDQTLLDITNEKGTKKLTSVEGVVLGYALIQDNLILFAKKEDTKLDCIYKVSFNKDALGELVSTSKLIWSGDLQFDINYPIETLSSYENKDVLKVYWVDGKNQPRWINIAEDIHLKDAEYFNFLPALIYLPHTIDFKKKESGGLFPSGVVLYFLTFVNKNGLESAIFKQSDLYAASLSNKASNPESGASSSFSITISGDTPPSPIFEYIRIYSIVRTSIDAVPTAKRVVDLKLPITSTYVLTFTDTNSYGETIDPSELLFKGGDLIVASTIALKDNTLFLGDIKSLVNNVSSSEVSTMLGNGEATTIQDLYIRYSTTNNSSYPYVPYTLKDNVKRIFKSNDWVRLGVIFLHKSGKWSEPIWLKDYKTLCVTDSYSFQLATNISGNHLTYTKSGILPTTLDALKKLGYIRAKGVAVFPEPGQGEVLALGVLCPTVHNVGDRKAGLVTNYSSWFFRPTYAKSYNKFPSSIRYGAAIQATHDECLSSAGLMAGEILSIDTTPSISNLELETTNKYDDYFYVDSSVVTFHSPDVEFNTYLNNMSLSGLSLRVVGVCGYTQRFSSLSITALASNEGSSFVSNIPDNIYIMSLANDAPETTETMSASPSWRDEKYQTSDLVDFIVYPWNRNGSLKDTPDTETYTKADLLLKKMSNYRYCEATKYLETPLSIPIYDMKLHSSDQEELLTLSAFLNGLTSCMYKANVDKIINTNGREYSLCYIDKDTDRDKNLLTILFKTDHTSAKPIRMKYKSTPHIVIAMKLVLPCIVNGEYPLDQGHTYYCNRSKYTAPKYQSIPAYEYFDKYAGYLIVGEIIRLTSASEIFGDTSNDTIKGLKWVTAGEAIRLDLVFKNDMFTLDFTQGNAFLTRYDCLKTYPYTLEDLNSVVEIGSYILESFVNMDGRYDNNIGNINNLVALPSNFNLVNPIYSQMNNFISYRVLDNRLNTTTEYPNTIVWSKTKLAGALIDAWTSINLASSIDVDGTYGRVRALKLFNNQLIGFLDNATFNLLYNSRILVATSDSVPIEISNSGKVDGKVYLSNTIGLTNKWALTQSSEGLYFIDNNQSSIYRFNGKFSNISTELGVHSWMNQNNTTDIFSSPKVFSNFKSYYDKSNNDVYFVNKDTCLCFSETLNSFTSFFDYSKSMGMVNIMDKYVALHLDSSGNTDIWEMNGGEYNKIFGEYKPYYTTIVANLDYSYDKIFNTVEYRADVYDSLGEYLPYQTFDTLEAWNAYQRGASDLLDRIGNPSTLKKKFNVWRANIPRSVGTRDRLRNTSAFIKLGTTKEGNYSKNQLMRLHDIMVHYTV